jgi:hypothetical protein
MYYLLLCTDEAHHAEQIRLICSEMKLYDGLKIVLPRQALAFYEMTDLEVTALVTRLLCSQDLVHQSALKEIKRLQNDHAFMMVAILCNAFDGQLKLTNEDLFMLYDKWLASRHEKENEENQYRLSDIVEELEGTGILLREEEMFEIEIPRLPLPLCALYFDQKHRHSARRGEMADYLCALLKIGYEENIR